MILPPDSFYAALDEEYVVSQSDIIRNVPAGIIPAPVHVCRHQSQPTETKPGNARFGSAELFPNPAGFSKGPELIHAKAKPTLAMVLWQDCQLDKKANQAKEASKHFAGIAPIRLLSEFKGAEQNIIDGKRPPLFYLPPFPAVGILEPMCVDLRLIWPVQQSLLSDRATTLAGPSKLLLYEHLFWFFTAKGRPSQITCPHCGGSIDDQTDDLPGLAESE